MKRIIIALVAAAGLNGSVNVARADNGGYIPPGGAKATTMPSMSQMAGPNTIFGAGDCPPGRAPDRYGLHPCLKKFFHIPTATSGYGANSAQANGNPLSNPANWPAAGYGMGGPSYNPNGFPPNAYGMAGGMGGPGCPAGPNAGYGPGGGPMMQGTLAFPYNSFVRSPRDFFMVDVNK